MLETAKRGDMGSFLHIIVCQARHTGSLNWAMVGSPLYLLVFDITSLPVISECHSIQQWRCFHPKGKVCLWCPGAGKVHGQPNGAVQQTNTRKYRDREPCFCASYSVEMWGLLGGFPFGSRFLLAALLVSFHKWFVK